MRRFLIFVLFSVCNLHPVFAQPMSVADLMGTWRVALESDQRVRIMEIQKAEPGADGVIRLKANYGWESAKPSAIVAELKAVNNRYAISFMTPSSARIDASMKSANVFEGTFQGEGGKPKTVTLTKVTSGAQQPVVSLENAGKLKRQVHFIYLGGNDCPPCVAWRALELPKLQQTQAFKASQFTYVVKTIKSAIPSAVFLPDEVKQHKPMLDEVSAGLGGSPQFALLVDGKIYDYYRGTRDASMVEQMLISAQTGSPYPMPSRCLLYQSDRSCKQSIATQ